MTIWENAMQYQLLINGVLVDGEGERQSVYNPATGEVILEIAEASPAQVDAAVLAADSAFAEWGQTTPKARAECLLKLADSIEQTPLSSPGLNRKTAVSLCTA